MYYYNPLVPVKNEDGTWYRNLNISQNYNPLSMINEDRYDTKEKLGQRKNLRDLLFRHKF